MSSDADFTDWAEGHAAELLRRAYLLSGDRQRAEDLVQETLVRIFLHWRRIDHDDNPVGYAHTVLFRLFASQRRRRSSGELPTEHLPERPTGRPDTELQLDLVAALQTLGPVERCVVVARYLDDRSVSEVAEMMRRSQSWVRTTSFRALRRLRDSPAMALAPAH